MKNPLFLILVACSVPAAAGAAPPAEKPRLVVLIVLDQFPYEYLARFGPSFGTKGLGRIMQEGALFSNARYGHAFTKTAPGHAAISTGTYARSNGIIANRWYDRTKRVIVNCVDDDSSSTLGNGSPGRSPRTLRTYTLGDMLRLNTNFRAKVFGVSNKDRSAVLMAGKFGTAYWMDDSMAVTSSYYMPSLAPYVAAFNRSGIFTSYYGKAWTECRPAVAAAICDRENQPSASVDNGPGRIFPHIVDGGRSGGITPHYYTALQNSPFATEILLRLAETTCVAETLGRRGVTDMLCVGISATDEVGHIYGPASREVFDDAVRTDSLIGEFLAFLDREVGLGKCLIAVTSDHGIAPVPERVLAAKPAVPAGRVLSKELREAGERALVSAFGAAPAPWISEVVESEVYFNAAAALQRGVPRDSALGVLKRALLAHTAVAAVYSRHDLEADRGPMAAKVAASCFPERSGDLEVVLKPFYIFGSDGTNHGMPYDYDTHVPVILWGKPFKAGMYRREVSPVDIAPTIANVLGIEFPPSREGTVLVEAIK